MFLPAVAVYKQLYEDLGVKTTEEYDAKLSAADGDDVQRVLSKLESLEVEWNKFLTTLDPEVKEGERRSVVEGDIIATPVKLENARSGNQKDVGSGTLHLSGVQHQHHQVCRRHEHPWPRSSCT